MIVTCESCKSRYKLDDSKITGRGAKITCPKCKNVFVVYSRPEGTPDPTGMSAKDAPKPSAPGRAVAGATAPKPAPRAEPAPPSSWDDDEPTRVRDAGALASGRPAEPPKAEPPKAESPKVEPPKAEPPRAESKAEKPDEGPSHEISRPVGRPIRAAEPPPEEGDEKTDVRPPPGAAKAEPPGPPKSAAEIAARAAALDFRKVGVTTWKVKVKIGLIYDFSDIKTLRKYIQDGRVTPSDVVSWDGKSWRAIGEIPDLDAFFVETWDMLAATRTEPFDTLTPQAAASAPKPEVTESEPSRELFKDPFAEKNRKKPKEEPKKAAPAPAPTPSRRPLLALLLLLLLLGGGGGWWWWSQQQPVSKPPTPVGTNNPPPSGEDIRKRLNEDLQNSLKPAVEDTPPPTQDTPPEKVPVVPDVGTPHNAIPDGATPRNPRSNPTNTTAPIKQGDQTAADHEAVGDDAASSGDWSTAVQAYQKAVSLDSRSGRLVGKLGRAQYEAGDSGGAQANLKKAASLGWKDAHKYLGHLLAAAGDTAGANAEYQTYLAGNPRDAAEIQAIVAKMNGG